jgi:hypothetical protein
VAERVDHSMIDHGGGRAARRMLSRWSAISLLVLAVASSTAARAQTMAPSIFEHKLEVRLEGYLDGRTEVVRPWRQLVVRLVGTTGNERHFALTNIVVVSGNGTGFGLLEAFSPTRPNLFIAGDKDLIGQISASGPDELLKITGFVAFGSRWLLINRVEREAPNTER